MLFRKKNKFRLDDLESVITACLAGDSLAQEALIRLFYPYVQSIALRYGGGPEDAEEIRNDAFIKVFQNLEKYDYAQSFKTWLRAIVVNTAIDAYRKNQKYANQLDIEETDLADFNDDIIDRISADEILELVQKLPPGYRMVFTLYVIEGYSHKEIGEMLGISEGTSKSNLRDARNKLQRSIKQMHPQLHLAYAVKMDKSNGN